MSYFWEGFEKKARGGISSLESAGIFYPINILNALGATTPEAKESAKGTAEGLAHMISGDKKLRKNNLLQYLLNPATPGPFSEMGARLNRRHHASVAEHPIRSSLIPFYGMIRGGKAGKPKD